MSSPPVTIQITPDSKPAMPSWMGEVAAFAASAHPPEPPENHSGASAFRPRPLRSVRSHRFCRRPDRLCRVWRIDAVGLLRTARSVCRAVYGPVWPRSVASSLDSVPFSGGTGSANSRIAPHGLSKGSACHYLTSTSRHPLCFSLKVV